MSEVNPKDYEYCIEVERGKYHVVLTKDYHVKYLRYGEEWVNNPPGSKMMIALMSKVERLENALQSACNSLGADVSDYYEEE